MDIDIKVIKNLAVLARVDMNDQEMKEIADSFGPILEYVGQIKEISESNITDHQKIGDVPFNIIREDLVTNEGGEYTEKILDLAPSTEKGFLKVKQIL